MGNLSRLSNAKSRSISPENFTGEKGKGALATTGTGANAASPIWIPGLMNPTSTITANCRRDLSNAMAR